MSIVFVYGSLRKDMGNHGLLNNTTFLGEGTLDQPAKLYSNGGFPILSFDAPEMQANVRIEAYEVNAQQLQRLDQLEGYYSPEDHWYNRSSKVAAMDDGTILTGLIYHMDREHNLPVVADGDWSAFVRSTRNGYGQMRRTGS